MKEKLQLVLLASGGDYVDLYVVSLVCTWIVRLDK
jgi:hypothetical protein